MKQGEPRIKIKNKFTMIENDLYEWTIKTKRLCFPESKIVDAIIRKTNGYHKFEAQMSYRYIEKMTGIHRRNVEKYIKTLIFKNIIDRRKGPKKKYGKPVYIYKINKEHCRLPGVSTDVNGTPEPGIREMTNKETNIFIRERRKLIDNFNMN